MNPRIPALLFGVHGAVLALPVAAEPAAVISINSVVATSHERRQQCRPELITQGEYYVEEGERIRGETPWFVPYVVPVTGAILGAAAGSQLGQGRGTDALTLAGGVLGGVFGPGAVVGAVIGGALLHGVARELGASDHVDDAVGVVGALGGAMLGKSLFDEALASASPYYAHAVSGPPRNPHHLRQVERCSSHLRARYESSAYLVTYLHRSEQRTATLPFDPGDSVLVNDEGAVDLAAYEDGVPPR